MSLITGMMPECDGYEATRIIQSDPDIPFTPIVALTASAIRGERERCLEAGMVDFLSKPWVTFPCPSLALVDQSGVWCVQIQTGCAGRHPFALALGIGAAARQYGVTWNTDFAVH